MLVYYRFLTFLKAISFFRHMIAMYQAIVVDILDILLIFVFIIISFGLLFAKSNISELNIG